MKRHTINEMRKIIATAFGRPVGFPHVSQVVYPGDKVTVAADAFTVSRPMLLAGIVAEIVSVGLDANDLTVLMLEQERKMHEQALRDALTEDYRASIRVVAHNPKDPQCLAMLGVTKDDTPILLNRVLVDADVVIPVERYITAPGMGYFGMQSVVYPRFADAETQERFLFFEAKRNRKKLLAKYVAEVGEVAYCLGVTMTAQIMVDDQEDITGIIFGDAKTIAMRF